MNEYEFLGIIAQLQRAMTKGRDSKYYQQQSKRFREACIWKISTKFNMDEDLADVLAVDMLDSFYVRESVSDYHEIMTQIRKGAKKHGYNEEVFPSGTQDLDLPS